MRKRACEMRRGKNRSVVARDISQEPVLKRLNALYKDMTQEEKDRTGNYLRQKQIKGGNRT